MERPALRHHPRGCRVEAREPVHQAAYYPARGAERPCLRPGQRRRLARGHSAAGAIPGRGGERGRRGQPLTVAGPSPASGERPWLHREHREGAGQDDREDDPARRSPPPPNPARRPARGRPGHGRRSRGSEHDPARDDRQRRRQRGVQARPPWRAPPRRAPRTARGCPRRQRPRRGGAGGGSAGDLAVPRAAVGAVRGSVPPLRRRSPARRGATAASQSALGAGGRGLRRRADCPLSITDAALWPVSARARGYPPGLLRSCLDAGLANPNPAPPSARPTAQRGGTEVLDRKLGRVASQEAPRGCRGRRRRDSHRAAR